MITTGQKRFIRDLLHERVVKIEDAERLREKLIAGSMDYDTVQKTIAWLKRQPYVSRVAVDATATDTTSTNVEPAQDKFDAQTLEIGIYELAGKIYKIKQTKDKTRKYAMVLTYDVGTAERLTASGTVINAEYTFAKGAIYDLRPEHRITGDRAEQLSIVFSSCIVCGRHLKAADSVARGIGPVCMKKI